MVAGRMSVIVVAVAAQDGELVGDLRTARQMFAEKRARHRRGNLLIRAADFRGGLGLEVPHVDGAGAPFQKQEDARLRRGGRFGRGLGLQLQQPRQREPADQAGGADSQGAAAGDAVAVFAGAAFFVCVRHGELPRPTEGFPWAWLVIVQELFRVQQRPQEIFGGVPTIPQT